MTHVQTAELPRLEARFAPSTWNPETRTVELSWGRGVDVERYDWSTGQRYIERLTMDPAAVDLTRLNSGAPLLNTHGRWSLDDVIGTVERAWIENGEGRAVVRFSARDDVRDILRDVQDGILRNVSVGYAVDEWQESRDEKGRLIRTAIRWTPHEISLVPIPADASAQVRAAGGVNAPSPGNVSNKEGRMADETNVLETPAVDEAAIRAAAAEAERKRIASLEAPAAKARALAWTRRRLPHSRRVPLKRGWTRLRSKAFSSMRSPRGEKRMRKRGRRRAIRLASCQVLCVSSGTRGKIRRSCWMRWRPPSPRARCRSSARKSATASGASMPGSGRRTC